MNRSSTQREKLELSGLRTEQHLTSRDQEKEETLGSFARGRFDHSMKAETPVVAMDNPGQRVAAVTTGVAYNPGIPGAMQQSAELMGGTNPLRVCVWDLPAHN